MKQQNPQNNREKADPVRKDIKSKKIIFHRTIVEKMSTKDSKNSNKSAVEEVDEIATLPTAIDDHEDGEIVKRITVREPIVQVLTPDAGPSTSTANQNPDPKLMAVLKSLQHKALHPCNIKHSILSNKALHPCNINHSILANIKHSILAT